MKKRWNIAFVAGCLALCVIPFAGMTIARTDVTTENKTLAKFPALIEDGSINTAILEEMGSYFEDHFALRQQLVTVDAELQSNVFGVSNVDTVIKGTDGWLYYTATLDDFLAQNTMSERSVFNAVHNLALLQQYVTDSGASFLLTIPPNKNSLYGEHMPYYDRKIAGDTKNMTLLTPALEAQQIAYVDLFQVFEKQDEVLYWKRDSHWNQKGALLAYNAMLDAVHWEHETYESTEVLRTKTAYGDLNRMLYPLTAKPEWNYDYSLESGYQYVTETESVEDAWIQTANKGGTGSLLMFRDSFGNTLLPFFASAFTDCYFSKAMPYDIASYLERYNPDVVIVEKVERNVNEFAEDPPIMPGPTVTVPADLEATETNTSVQMESFAGNTAYWTIYGTVDTAHTAPDMVVYVQITDGDSVETFEAFTTTVADSDYGYQLYVPKSFITGDAIQVEILTKTGDTIQSVCSADFGADILA